MVFFILVTIGVALSAEASAGVLLGAFVVFVIFAVALYERWAVWSGRRPFSLSFAEGEENHTLLVEATGKIDVLDDCSGLVQYYENRTDGRVSYVVNLRTRREFTVLVSELDSVGPVVVSVEGRYGQSEA